MKKDWKPYALHILDCITKIKLIQERGDITHDEILYDAVLRNLQTLSEATRHLPEDKILQYPTIPWKNISGFRNILVHDYLGTIDATTVLNVVTVYLLPLQSAIVAMIDDTKNK